MQYFQNTKSYQKTLNEVKNNWRKKKSGKNPAFKDQSIKNLP